MTNTLTSPSTAATLRSSESMVPVESPKWVFKVLFGIMTAMSGLTMYWSHGLAAGLGGFSVALAFMIVCTVCVMLSISEIGSSFQLHGGPLILVRCSIGFFPGYLYGMYQIAMYSLLSAFIIYNAAHTLWTSWTVFQPYQIEIISMFYISSLLTFFVHKDMMARIHSVVAMFGIFVVIVFIFASLPYINFSKFSKYTTNNSEFRQWFPNGISETLENAPLALWFFMGIESLTFKLKDSSASINAVKVSYLVTSLLIFLSITVLLVSASLPPGIYYASRSDHPLYEGYRRAFHLQRKYFAIICVIIQTGSAHGFLTNFSQVFHTLASANALPKHLLQGISRKAANDQITIDSKYGIIIGNILSFGFCVLIWISRTSQRVCMMTGIFCALVNNILICLTYARMKTKFPSVTRCFQSPLGSYGAHIGSLLSLLFIVAILGFQNDNIEIISSFMIYTGVISINYIVFVAKSQSFSDEEMRLIFTTLVKKFNLRIEKRLRSKSVAPTPNFANASNNFMNILHNRLRFHSKNDSKGFGNEDNSHSQKLPPIREMDGAGSGKNEYGNMKETETRKVDIARLDRFVLGKSPRRSETPSSANRLTKLANEFMRRYVRGMNASMGPSSRSTSDRKNTKHVEN